MATGPAVAGPSAEAAEAAQRLIALTEDPILRRILRLHLQGDLAADPEAGLIACLRAATADAGLKKLLAAYLERGEDAARTAMIARLLRRAPHVEDFLASMAAATWLQDARFQQAYEAGRRLAYADQDLRWRRYTLMTCAARAAALEGDFVECGVERGGGAQSVIAYLGPEAFAGRRFYLFDTFSGLVEEQMTEEERRRSGRFQDRYPPVADAVRAAFAERHFVEIVEGPVPETLGRYRGGGVAFLHIDMNVAAPECAALRYFWPHLQPGAPVIFDDYGFPTCEEQRRQLDRVASTLGVQILMLPSGQGLLWR